MFERSVLKDITKRILEPRKFIQVLVGPRQVGKTTLIKQFLQKTDLPYYFVTGDDFYLPDTTWIRREWANVRLQMQQKGVKEYLFIIDEVQKVPNWSEAIKKEWDADTFSDTNIKTILLGSSRLLIQEGLTESLAGRYELTNLTHWSFEEMRGAFDWNIIRKRASKPKFQVHNNALLSAGEKSYFSTVRHNSKEWGRFVESAIGAHLINSGLQHRFNTFYWNQGNAEVDYVIEKRNKIIALEVKSGRGSTGKGLALFENEFHPHGIYLIGTNGIPLDQFLSMNPADLFDL